MEERLGTSYNSSSWAEGIKRQIIDNKNYTLGKKYNSVIIPTQGRDGTSFTSQVCKAAGFVVEKSCQERGLINKFTDKAVDGLNWFIEKIETGGLFFEFTIIDLLGMILPRTYQAFMRNSEELGHPNYKAGTEEAIREFLTGPSMFLLPMGFLAMSERIFGSSSKINFDNLKRFEDSFVQTAPKIKATDNKKSIAEKFYRHVIDQAYTLDKLKNEIYKTSSNEVINNLIKLSENDEKLAILEKEFNNKGISYRIKFAAVNYYNKVANTVNAI